MKTLIAKRDSAFGITKGKAYKAEDDNGSDVVLVENDVKVKIWVNKDLFESEHLSNAKRIANEAEALAECERVRDNILGSGWKIHKAGMAIYSNDYEPNEYVKILEKLREVMRVPEGENIVTHAKVLRALADALIGLQK